MAAAHQARNVFNIPAGVPFLPALAEALLDGRLVPFDRTDPLALAGVTILLPTRRAARAFADLLFARAGGEALLLPSIRPIGDLDDDAALFDDAVAETGDRLVLPEALSPLTRRLTLTRMTLAWAKQVRRALLGLKDGEPLLIPASAGDAARLAADLARLIDDLEVAPDGWARLQTVVPADHAEYFQVTLQFLEIIAAHWPNHLVELSRADPVEHRNSLIRAAAKRLRERGSAGPIVAAGSTGSLAATAELIAAIARLPNGAVVLPGLDVRLDDAGWRAIDGPDEEDAAAGHPQRALKQLIGTIGIEREAVTPLVETPPAAAARTRVLSEAMRPSATLEAWRGFRPDASALAGVGLILARNEQEEAAAIAVALRETLETPGATAALVTPDRTLARRVAAELGRWNLAVDDSAGTPVAKDAAGVFARLLIEAAASDGEPVSLLALFKHPYAAFGMPRPRCRAAARALELALFRGHRVAGGLRELPTAVERARAALTTEERVPGARRRLNGQAWSLAADLARSAAACLLPLRDLLASNEVTLAAALACVYSALAAAQEAPGEPDALWSSRGGEALARFLEEAAADTESANLSFRGGEFPGLFGALLDDITVQRPVGGDPRLHIWGALEARLQSVDRLILGGLDEGVWPAAVRTDPWLSRAMRREIGLPSPERRLGLSAHDFFQGVATESVIVTRAEKRGGAPTVESRWLQRLRALVGKDAAADLAARGSRWLELARELDAVDESEKVRIKRPAPAPALDVRPKSLSITEIETLIRDPYAVYAKHVLNLRPLEPIGRPPDGGLRGNLVHQALGDFVRDWRGPYDAAAAARLTEIAADVFRAVAEFPDVHAVWTLRFEAIVRWFVEFEAARDATVAERHAEIEGRMVIIPDRFTLNGRADRVDLMRDGTLAIYDFKTGTPQSERSVFAQVTPQMALEAMMARAGGFPGLPTGASVSDLAWLAVGRIGREDPYEPAAAASQKQTPDSLAASAEVLIRELVAAFADPTHPYASRLRPRMENDRYVGDYDHLARVREWALTESPEDVKFMGGGSP
jgi:ATP-dependent helicase/nuclease subunit B